MTNTDPAYDLAIALDTISVTKGAPAAIAMAEAMIAAATALLIREMSAEYAYGTLQILADDVPLQIVSRRVDYCRGE